MTWNDTEEGTAIMARDDTRCAYEGEGGCGGGWVEIRPWPVAGGSLWVCGHHRGLLPGPGVDVPPPEGESGTTREGCDQ